MDMNQQESGENTRASPGKNEHSLTRRSFTWVAVIGLMIGLTAFYQALTQRSSGITQGVNEYGRAMVVLQRQRNGHYLAEGEINGQPLVFLVDTGATDVAVSVKTAKLLKLEFGPRIQIMTAAGPARAWVTRIQQVRVGKLVLNDVRAMITPGLGDEALLGMSFLKHFSLRQENGHLVIESGGANREESG
jgi:aspartyl protease family protein